MKFHCPSIAAVAIWGIFQAVTFAHAVTFTPLIVDGPKVGLDISAENPGYLWFYALDNDALLKVDAFEPSPNGARSAKVVTFSVAEGSEIPTATPGDPYVVDDLSAFQTQHPWITKDVYISDLGGEIAFPAGIVFLTVTLENQDPTIFFQLVSTDSITTPLPPALCLFASALGLIGLVGWRRKRKGAAALAA